MGPESQSVLIFDGACGSNIQTMGLEASAWGKYEGLNEALNLTCREAVVELHSRFLEAGAMVLETNTFGASRIVLGEYGLEDKVDAINKAAVVNARKAIGDLPDRYVAGSVGPTTKLPTLGHIHPRELYAAYQEQIQSLVEASVDILIVETCQDLLQLKTAIRCCFETLERLGVDILVMASVTMERTQTMLLGTDIEAAATTLEPFPLFSFGLNCATGPTDMESSVRYLSEQWPKRISCLPNQGLPEVVEGRTVYQLKPEEFASQMRRFVTEHGVSIVGGCCGTTPEHIAALARSLKGVRPKSRSVIQ